VPLTGAQGGAPDVAQSSGPYTPGFDPNHPLAACELDTRLGQAAARHATDAIAVRQHRAVALPSPKVLPVPRALPSSLLSIAARL